uniref:Uncharacterized protein n=1 Tax=Manihot esculenta TaxID=3983 RepID=A0A2C9WCJ8_MANES
MSDEYQQDKAEPKVWQRRNYFCHSQFLLRWDSIIAFVPVMRSCTNMCFFALFLLLEGRERSHLVDSIVKEVAELGRKEIKSKSSEGFSSMCKVKKVGLHFSDLLDQLSTEFPEMCMRDRYNICIHLPARTVSSTIPFYCFLWRKRRSSVIRAVGYIRAYVCIWHEEKTPARRNYVDDIGDYGGSSYIQIYVSITFGEALAITKLSVFCNNVEQDAVACAS